MMSGARGRTRTGTPVKASGPKPGASTNFATRAATGCKTARGPVRTPSATRQRADSSRPARPQKPTADRPARTPAARSPATWSAALALEQAVRRRDNAIGRATRPCRHGQCPGVRAALRKLPRRLAAVPGRAAPGGDGDLPLRAHGRRPGRRRRCRPPRSGWRDLAAYRADLQAALRRAGPTAAAGRRCFRRWPLAMRRHALPAPWLHALLDAFEQDVRNPRYADRAALLDYCAARPTRSAGCCCTCTGRRCAVAAPVRRHLQRPATDQLLAGPERRPAARPASTCRWPTCQRHGLDAADAAARPRRRRRPARWCATWCNGPRALMAEGAPLALRLPGRAGWELRLVVQGGLRILEKIAAMDYASCSHAAGAAAASTRPCCCGARCGCSASSAPAGQAAISPQQYVQDKAAASGSSLLLRLPVPAAAAPRRDHRLLCLLPRGRRRGRRDQRRRRGRGQAGLVAPGGAAGLRRPAQPPGDEGADAAGRRLRHPADAPAGGDRGLPDRPAADALPRLSPACSATATWWPAWWARSRPTSSAAREAGTRAVRAPAGPGDAAHQHHPRRRRRRAARPHLPADVRAAAVRRQGARDPASATRPGATASASTR